MIVGGERPWDAPLEAFMALELEDGALGASAV